MSDNITLKVAPEYQGYTLIKFLKASKVGVPYSLLQKLLRKKAIRVNGKRAKEDLIVKHNDEITIPAYSKAVEKPDAKATRSDFVKYIQNNIIFEDKNCYAINKPQGLATQGGSKIFVNVDMLLDFLKKEGQPRPMLVHRLDRYTSGVLLVAKNTEAARILGESFKHRFIEKKYLALVAGRVLPIQGSIDSPLGKRMGAGNNEKIMVDMEQGKKAYTEYKVLEHFGTTASLLEVTPRTGRKHQIRVHLASIGHPIIGDGKYGGSKAFVEGISKDMHLHAWKLTHTENYFKGTIEAAPPKNFYIN